MALFQKYCGYAAHVSRTVYHDAQQWEQKREETEQQWPEFMTSTLALSRPRYQSADAQQMDGPAWRRLFLEKDVEALQQLKQHHVHLPKVENGPRLPLDHCRDRRDPTKCKSGFPREKRLTNRPVLVCKGLAEQMEMPIKGKRSALGQIWGPCNDANLNGNHPAMLAALRCNGDVQLPYRFPIIEELHEACGRCTASCPEDQGARETTRQAQINQAAQSGYACDYGNKRLPIAINEVGEWQKSQKELETELENNPSSGYVGARTSKRIMTQCFCRGVCRGACECANLLDHANKSDPTAAEAIKTAPTAELSLSFGLQLLQAATLQTPLPAERAKMQADNRELHHNKAVVQCPQNWTLYGNRGRDPRVHSLSAYEFARYYHCRQAYFPWTAKDQDQAAQAAVEAAAASSSQPRREQRMFHAQLTDSGKQKRADKVSKRNLQAGVDYVIQEQGGEDWMPLGKGSLAEAYRHDWIISPRKRPHAPVPYGALGSRSQDEHAKKMLLLFCPWTSNPEDATESVRYIGQLRTPEMTSWREALRLAWTRAGGFPTEELKRYVLSYAFVYCLPRTLQPDANLAANSDNEGMEDVIFHFEKDELDEAMKTRVRGAGAAQEQAPAADEAQEEQTHEATAAAPPNTTTQHDLTVQMINLSQSFWLGRASEETDLARRHARQHRQRVVFNRPDGVVSTERMLKDASKSRNRYEEEATVATQGLDNAGGRPAANALGRVSERLLSEWLISDHVRSSLNPEQREFLQLVVQRVLVEYGLMQAHQTTRNSEEPLLWLLHGGPGTGKSHVLNFVRRELFQQLLGYVQGIDFQVTAFQATNAADISGQTLHQAFGLNRDKSCLGTTCRPDTARRIALWRWLILDEVSMVSARLTAQVELRARSAVPTASQWKHDAADNIRPFAGMNVLFSGDFRQLPPPEGGFLADLPAALRAPGKALTGTTTSDPLIDHGQRLFWEGQVQGVTELVERERCKDDWWNEAPFPTSQTTTPSTPQNLNSLAPPQPPPTN